MKKFELFIPYWGVFKALYLWWTERVEEIPLESEKLSIFSGVIQLIFLLLLYTI